MKRQILKRLTHALPALLILVWALPAQAGGYDTPMLYSARHMGMGGTAVGYVNDPSALFHNPAGLAATRNVSLLGDFSLLVGTINGSPAADAISEESNTTIAPFFLLGGSVRLTDWLVAGLGVYPVASAGATYEYPNAAGTGVENSTTLLFVETSPALAVNIDAARLRLGVGYRITYVSLDRTQQTQGSDPSLEFHLKGLNFLGFRAGAQWEAVEDHLSIGLSYRHKTVTTLTGDTATIPPIFGSPTATDAESDFTLPSRLALGVRGDIEGFGAAIDVEYAFNSQNELSALSGDVGGMRQSLDNIFDWDDALTLRIGAEYDIAISPERTITPRLGYVFDARTSNKHYPTAFGTPPAPTMVLTGGVGYDAGAYQVNLAYAYRFGSTTVTADDISSAPETCVFCGKEGDYEIGLNGLYVDFSYDFD